MKKVIALILVLALCLSFAGCGKSEAAKHVDEMILTIGTVTLDSESSVKAAEAAYEALTQEQKDELENHAILVAARASLDDLLEQKRLEEEEAARIAELQAQAAEVDAKINAIGPVTLDKEEAISAARAAYDALDEEGKSYVTALSTLENAETVLKATQAENVMALIDGIGTVTKDSGTDIKNAEAGYAALSEEVKALVSNADVLTAARNEYNTQMEAFVDNYLKKLIVDEDKVRGINFYYCETFPYYKNYGYWGADVRSFVLPYIGIQGNSVWMRLVCDYTADDWVFFEKITFAVDDQRFYRYYSYYDVTRDNAYGDIWEYVDIAVGEEEIELLNAIVNSETTIVRFEGDDYYDDVEINASDKKAIADMLAVYEYLTNK
jgi:hypothetical protein